MMVTYPAVFTPLEDNSYQAVFPDLEECRAWGPDLEDTIDNAKEALKNWLMVEIEEGGSLPEQSHIDDIPLGENSFVKYLMVKLTFMDEYE